MPLASPKHETRALSGNETYCRTHTLMVLTQDDFGLANRLELTAELKLEGKS